MTVTGLLVLALGIALVTYAILPWVSYRAKALGSQAVRQSVNYKWWVFGSIAIGTFLSVVDHGSVLVALPEIEAHFNSDLPTVQWLVVGYALAISVLLLPMGRLGDILGRKQVYVSGFIIFVVAAALAGAAPNLEVLIAAKVLQGVGSAMVQGNGMATIVSVFPGTERGKGLGYHLSVVASGAIAGPALGGFLISGLGWRWVFFVNVPVGVLAIIATILIVANDRASAAEGGQRPAFDWWGAILSGFALLLFLLVVGNGERVGWSSGWITSGAMLAAICSAGFVWWELRTASPMLDLRLFRRKLVAIGAASGWLSFVGTSSTRFLMPFYLQRVLELEPRDVGLLMIPPALTMVVVGPLGGRLSDKFGWRWLTTGGLALSAFSWFAFAAGLGMDSNLVFVVGILMLQMAGTGFFNSPNNSSMLSVVDRTSYGVVSALTQLIRNSANVTSIAVATTVVVVTMGSLGVEPSLDAVSPAVADAFLSGLHRSFLLMGGILLVGMVISVLRDNRAPVRAAAPTPRQTPRAEPVAGTSSDD